MRCPGTVWMGGTATTHGKGCVMLASRPPRQTILVIDNDPAIRDLARDVLVGEGYRVVTAVTHDEALVALSSFRFSAVLADTAGSAATTAFDRWVELERIRAAAGDAPTVIF